MVLEGEVAQLRAVVDSDEFRSLLFRAAQVVDGLEVVHMAMGDHIQKTVMDLVAARRNLGITT
jgi:hypothetical protein